MSAALTERILKDPDYRLLGKNRQALVLLTKIDVDTAENEPPRVPSND